MVQQRPDNEFLSNFSIDIFKGYELHTTEPDFLGDRKHVKFFDKTVESKIKEYKYYKCWYKYSEPSDPSDSNKFYYFAYVEEVPDEIVKIIKNQKIITEYLNEKTI